MKNVSSLVKKIGLLVSAIGMSVVVTACGGSDGMAVGGQVKKIGGETVAIQPYEASGVAYKDVAQFAKSSSLIFVGEVTGKNEVAAEVKPSPNQEGGRTPGVGPDIYGSIDFKVDSVVKGDATKKTVRVVYLSGNRLSSRKGDANDKKKRIAYLLDNLSSVQKADSTLNAPNELAGKKFIVFVEPNGTSGGKLPVDGDVYVLVHPNAGIAEIGPNERLRFGERGRAPVGAEGTDISLSDVRTAVR